VCSTIRPRPLNPERSNTDPLNASTARFDAEHVVHTMKSLFQATQDEGPRAETWPDAARQLMQRQRLLGSNVNRIFQTSDGADAVRYAYLHGLA